MYDCTYLRCLTRWVGSRGNVLLRSPSARRVIGWQSGLLCSEIHPCLLGPGHAWHRPLLSTDYIGQGTKGGSFLWDMGLHSGAQSTMSALLNILEWHSSLRPSCFPFCFPYPQVSHIWSVLPRGPMALPASSDSFPPFPPMFSPQ